MFRRLRTTSWLVIVAIVFFFEFVVQLIWSHYDLSLPGWLMIQALFASWLVLACYRLIRTTSGKNRAPGDLGSSDELASPDPMENVISTEDLVGSVVHEIRKPLNRLRMRLKKNENGEPRLIEDLDEVTGIVEQIERVFRGSPPEKRWISVPRLVKQVLERFTIDGQLRVRTGLSWFYCAPEHMKIVLRNLIRNSLDAYGDRRGPITITVKSLGPEYCLIVEDEAGGIDPNLAQTINKSQPQDSSGMGLGLMISQKIMDNHNGRMVVESEEGSGTTVTLTVPIPEEPSWEGDSS